MNMVNKTNDLAQKFLEMDGDVLGSFADEKLNIPQKNIEAALFELDLGKHIFQTPLPTRIFSIIIDNLEQVDINLLKEIDVAEKEKREIFTEVFNPFIIQTHKKIYLFAVTKFDIFDHINREPNTQEEALESFHDSLKKNLGLLFAKAYFGNETEDITPEETKKTGIVAVIKTNFQSISIEGLNFIIFSL